MKNEYTMKETAQIIAVAVGGDETEIHQLLRGWNQGGVVRAANKLGDATRPLLYSENEIVKLAVLVKIRDTFPLRPAMVKSLFAWADFESKSYTAPDGTQISYSIEGAMKGVRANQKWAATVEPYQNLKDAQKGLIDPDSWSLIFAPSGASRIEKDEMFLRMPLNPILAQLLKQFEIQE